MWAASVSAPASGSGLSRVVEIQAQLERPRALQNDRARVGPGVTRDVRGAAGDAHRDEVVGGAAGREQAGRQPDRSSVQAKAIAGAQLPADRQARDQAALAGQVLDDQRRERRQVKGVDPERLAEVVDERSARGAWPKRADPGDQRIRLPGPPWCALRRASSALAAAASVVRAALISR